MWKQHNYKQRLDLVSGEYTIYFRCVDLGGNSDEASTTFKIEVDVYEPIVNRIYKDGDKIKVITDEKSSCSYSSDKSRKCNFILDEGTSMPYSNSTEHYAEWDIEKDYYIKCMDKNGRQPLPTKCSIILKAGEL